MNKLAKLKKILQALKSVVVAYSGGLDSTFLLRASIDALGRDSVLAVTARSETYPVSEYREAVNMAKKLGAGLLTIRTSELAIKGFRSNPVNRCYYCKKELFKRLDAIRKGRRFRYVIDGTNYDDLKDVRYGRLAAKELGVKSPLLEAKITKGDIRRFSRALGLATWDKPSFACLASRIPFNSAITKKGLRSVDGAESCLKGLGFRQVRVRIHGNIARLELSGSDLKTALKLKDSIVGRLKKLGFTYVTLDLAGYRTGSMHESASAKPGKLFAKSHSA
ncbi:MAG: ATP-dependent sacrificial sulfur transferase LarE [Candidatus Omnitrophica bacterium]|nr:ATP-dependent sacrificial sulfur transferase LarE [Candidatus Omnitrophota bacterium]